MASSNYSTVCKAAIKVAMKTNHKLLIKCKEASEMYQTDIAAILESGNFVCFQPDIGAQCKCDAATYF